MKSDVVKACIVAGIASIITHLFCVHVMCADRFTFESAKPRFEVAQGTLKTKSRSIVYLYTTANCQPCEQAKADLKAAKDLPFDIEVTAPKINVDSYPTLHWKAKEKWWQTSGWNGVEKFKATWQETQSDRSRTSTVLSARITTSIKTDSRSIRLKQFANSYRGQSTGVKGMTVREHLMDNRHGFTANELAGLNEHELERLHSACHAMHINAAWLRSYAERNGIR